MNKCLTDFWESMSRLENMALGPTMSYEIKLYPAGREISTRPLAQASVKTPWASTNCRFSVLFLKVTRLMVSAVKIKFPSLPRRNPVREKRKIVQS